MTDPEPEHLDTVAGGDDATSSSARRWLGVQFECCNKYIRIYKNKDGTAYVGWCPRCARRVRVPVGPGGTDNRFFRAH